MGKAPNGSGSIWQRKDGRWGAALSYPYHDPETGRTKSRRVNTTKRTWEEAHRWLIRKQSDLLGGVVFSPGTSTLGAFLSDWLRDVIEPSVAPKTYEKRAYHVGTHISPALGFVQLKDLEARMIHTFYVRLSRRDPPLALSTRRDIHTTFKMALNQAIRWGLLSANPLALVDPPRPGPDDDDEAEEVRALSNMQALRLFELSQAQRWHNYYVAGIRTGLRPGEMLGLQWQDLNLEAGEPSLRVRRTLGIKKGGGYYTKAPKTKGSRRTLILHWEAASAFDTQKLQVLEEGLPAGREDWVFPSRTGTPMHRGNLRAKHLQPALAAADLPRLTLHELRHTFASIMLYEWRVPLEVVSQMMGHKNTRMTQELYGHLVQTAQADAIHRLYEAHGGAPGPPDEWTKNGGGDSQVAVTGRDKPYR